MRSEYVSGDRARYQSLSVSARPWSTGSFVIVRLLPSVLSAHCSWRFVALSAPSGRMMPGRSPPAMSYAGRTPSVQSSGNP